MKTYLAIGGFRDGYPIQVEEDRTSPDTPPRAYQLAHHAINSPDGHSWGYAGSGPTDTARDILWDLLGVEPEPNMVQHFKRDVVAKLNQDFGFRLPEAQVRAWLEQEGLPPNGGVRG